MKTSLLHRLPLLALLLVPLVVQSFAPSSSCSPLPSSIATTARTPGGITTIGVITSGGCAALHSTRPSTSDKTPTSTEDLLLQVAERKRLGLRQEYGCTVKKDGWDSVRSAVWFLFDVSNVVFTFLGALLTMGLVLNLMGYGYFWDEQGRFTVQTLAEIRHDHIMDAELVRLTREMHFK
jgi:hypothetical protein